MNAIQALKQPAARAELRAEWAYRLSRTDVHDQAIAEMRTATIEANQPIFNNDMPEQLAVLLVMRARSAVRSVVQHISLPPGDLPAWAEAPITDEHVDFVNSYAMAASGPTEVAALDAHRELLTSPDFRVALTALVDLNPANQVPKQLLALLDEIDQCGVDEVFARRSADHDWRALLDAWINTPTWTESHSFFSAYRELLLTEPVIDLLSSIDDDTARQHLAILQLTTALPDRDVYTIVTDAAQAESAALDAIQAGDLTTLSAILTAATPVLVDRPVTGLLAAAVVSLGHGQLDEAQQFARAAAAQATPLQRRAHVIRLRSLLTHQRGLPGIDELITILETHPGVPAVDDG